MYQYQWDSEEKTPPRLQPSPKSSTVIFKAHFILENKSRQKLGTGQLESWWWTQSSWNAPLWRERPATGWISDMWHVSLVELFKENQGSALQTPPFGSIFGVYAAFQHFSTNSQVQFKSTSAYVVQWCSWEQIEVLQTSPCPGLSFRGLVNWRRVDFGHVRRVLKRSGNGHLLNFFYRSLCFTKTTFSNILGPPKKGGNGFHLKPLTSDCKSKCSWLDSRIFRYMPYTSHVKRQNR